MDINTLKLLDNRSITDKNQIEKSGDKKQEKIDIKKGCLKLIDYSVF